MAKVTLTGLQKEQERIRNNLKLLQGGRSNTEMAKIFGASQNTYARRLKHPDELTFYEAYCICRKFKVDISRFYTEELEIT